MFRLHLDSSAPPDYWRTRQLQISLTPITSQQLSKTLLIIFQERGKQQNENKAVFYSRLVEFKDGRYQKDFLKRPSRLEKEQIR
jgi:hypothetical protein